MRVRLRPAGSADLAACQAIWEASAAVPPDQRPVPNPLYAHELATGRLLVATDDAENAENAVREKDASPAGGGPILGFGASLERDGRWFLADLFVTPAGQSGGVGRLILDALTREAPADRFTSASDDVRAQALYTRAGMAPRWPLYELRSTLPPAAGRLPVPWLRPEPADALDPELARFDAELSGIDRTLDLRWLCREAGARALWLVDELGARQGYALLQPSNPFTLDPAARPAATVAGVGVRRPDLAVDAVLATIGCAADWGRPSVRLHVPGPHPALPVLLEGGFRMHGADIYCASSEALFDPTRRLASSSVF